MPQDELAGALAGQPGAWDRLVRRFERLLRDVGRQYRLTPADLEDAMQTTWLQLFRRMHDPRSGGPARLARDDDAARVPAHDPAAGPRGAVGDEPIEAAGARAGPAARDCSSLSAATRSGRRSPSCPERHRDLMLLLTTRCCYAEVSSGSGCRSASIGPIRARSLVRLERDARLRRLCA